MDDAMRLIVAIVVLAAVGLILLGRYLVVFHGFLPGYRGAVGFKNRSDVALTGVRLTGLSTVVEGGTLAPGEHSFSYVRRQALPAAVEISWRTTAAGAVQSASVSLESVPESLKDGEIFLVFAEPQGWTVESSPELRLDELLRDK